MMSSLQTSFPFKTQIPKPKCFDEKYKTELCKKYSETGKCPYGSKCLFAHGKEELISKKQCTNYKRKQCKTFYECGYCPYGSRCNFKHYEYSFQNTKIVFSLLSRKLNLFKRESNNSSFINIFDETTTSHNDYVSIKENVENEYPGRNSSSFSTISNEE